MLKNKRIIIIFLLGILFLITGCSHKTNQNDGKDRLYLTEKYYNKGEYITVSKEELLSKESETYLLFTYNNYCNLSVPCDQIFAKFMKKYNIDILSIPYEDFKETSFYETVKFAPSILIVDKAKVIAYLDAEKDEDLSRYQDADEFEKWLNEYIFFVSK
jgi:hypothetical protein